MQGRGKRECPERAPWQAASSSTIPPCEGPGVNPPGIEPGSPWWYASVLATAPPLPLKAWLRGNSPESCTLDYRSCFEVGYHRTRNRSPVHSSRPSKRTSSTDVWVSSSLAMSIGVNSLAISIGSGRVAVEVLAPSFTEGAASILRRSRNRLARSAPDIGYGAVPECKGGETGDSRENLLTSGIVRHDSRLRISGVIWPGIEPSSPLWKASSLTAQPLRPLSNLTHIHYAVRVYTSILGDVADNNIYVTRASVCVLVSGEMKRRQHRFLSIGGSTLLYWNHVIPLLYYSRSSWGNNTNTGVVVTWKGQSSTPRELNKQLQIQSQTEAHLLFHLLRCRPPLAQSVVAPLVWSARDSGFESLLRHGSLLDVRLGDPGIVVGWETTTLEAGNS
ncbi:hypothetical protein PR048_010169 [Dryococelus australis]|uniref:Uncharacterized protein n=1 Tax=Dryococelus australis TaxID=614101 RepID=A0ABQ9I1Y1_9NEOP|nr:hypothetical protein PR048_010169 [Dryococelus australis]